MPGAVKDARVMPSGTMVCVSFVDGSGNDSVVTGLTTATVQSVKVSAGGGTFTLSFNGQTTAAIRAGALASEVQAALEALATIGAGNVAVSGAGPWRVAFIGALANTAQPAITIDGTLLTADPPTTPTTAGTTAALRRGLTSGGVTRTGGWTVSSYQQGGDGFAYALENGDSTQILTTSITGLSAGVYSLTVGTIFPDQVAANFPAGWTPATNARFRFYDGATLDGTAVYRGEARFNLTWDGFPLTTYGPRGSLASVYCASGTLWVVTADDADLDGGAAFGFLTCEPLSGRMVGPNAETWPAGGSDRTLAVWFTPATADLTSGPALIDYGLRGSLSGAELFIDGTGVIGFHCIGFPVLGTTALTAGTTYLGVFTLAGGNATLYTNATGEGTAHSYVPNTLWQTTDSAVTVGWSNGNWNAQGLFHGTIHRAGVWDRGLSAAEVTTLYNGGTSQPFASLSAGLQSGCVAYYDALDTEDGTDAAGSVTLTPYDGAAPAPLTPTDATTITQPGGCPVAIHRDGGAAEDLDLKVIWGDLEPGDQSLTPYALFPVVGAPITAGQAITVDLKDGTITVAAGKVPGVSGIIALNHVGGAALPPDPTGTPRLRVGYNIAPGDSGAPQVGPCDLLKVSGGGWGGGPNDSRDQGIDANGYATLDFDWWHQIFNSDLSVLPTGYPAQPWGDYTVVWDGAGSCHLDRLDPSHVAAVEQTDKAVITGTTDNVRVFTFTYDAEQGFTGPQLILWMNVPVTNARVYPPGVLDEPGVPPAGGWDAIPTFNPEYISRITGVKALRTMSWNNANSTTFIDETDYVGTDNINWWGGPERDQYASVATLESYAPTTYGPGSYGTPGLVYVKVTTSAPHGLRTGAYVNFFPESGSTDTAWTPGNQQYTFTANDGSGQTLSCWFNGSPIFVIDSTTFVYPRNVADSGGVGRPFDPVTPNLMTAKAISGAMPPERICDLVNALPDCDLWWNMPCPCTDAAVPIVAQRLAAALAPGRRIIYEFANEPWQFSFTPRLYATVAGANDASGQLSPEQWMARRSAETWRIFRDAWQQAGRTEDVLHVLNVQFGFTGQGQSIINYITDRDDQGRPSTDPNYSGAIHIDGLAAAPYWFLAPFRANVPDANYDALTLEQTMDAGDAMFLHVDSSFLKTNAQIYVDMLEAYDPTCSMFGYEGGPNYCGLGGTESISDPRSMAWTFHPRARGQQLAMLQMLNDVVSAGGQVKWHTYCQYQCDDSFRPEADSGNGTNYPKNYGVFKGLKQLPGKGDGTDGTLNNLPHLTDAQGMAVTPVLGVDDGAGGITPYTSVIGGAIKDWNLGVTAPATLVSIAVTPANTSIDIGASQAFTATGTYSDSTIEDLTDLAVWESSDSTVAALVPSHTFQGVKAGAVTISATYEGITGSTGLTVQSTGGGGDGGQGASRRPRGWVPPRRQRHRSRIFGR